MKSFRRGAKTLAVASFIAAGTCTVPACMHDFAAFEPGAGDSIGNDGSADGPSGLEAAASTDAAIVRDGAAGDASDGASGDGAACTAAPACAATSKTCGATCDQTLTTCTAACGGNNGCKNKCIDDRDKCKVSCTSTCAACAGTGCAAACN